MPAQVKRVLPAGNVAAQMKRTDTCESFAFDLLSFAPSRRRSRISPSKGRSEHEVREFPARAARSHVWKVAVAYTAAAVVLLEVLTPPVPQLRGTALGAEGHHHAVDRGPASGVASRRGVRGQGGARALLAARIQETKPALPTPATPAPPSIAVLPFEDMSPEQDQKYPRARHR